ncbi:hypothetical protein B0H11DRAFT_1966695 [Mycena galericulata]|nr:hypothetical protein B0H11DRAFT_1966695 [Mycena galericulata]
MPHLLLNNGVKFFYTDSGSTVHGQDYTTVVVVHGHSFHSGTFQKLSPLAALNRLRLVCVNRREYPGSSPYTAQELKVFNEGTDAERAVLLGQQGHDLALFVDGLIDVLPVTPAGGIMLVGWSIGTIFLLSLIASIATLPFEMRARLCPLVHTVVLLQSPSVALGLPIPQGLLIPHTDPRIPAEEKGSAFAKWVSSYFLHGDLTGHELEQLTYDKTDPSRPSTIEKLNPEEFLAITDFGPGDKYDSIIGLSPFRDLLFAQMNKALFDPEVRAAWGANFWNIYGDAEPWPMMYAAWFLEDCVDVRKAPELALTFQVIDGANHFLVWENPAQAMEILTGCRR